MEYDEFAKKLGANILVTYRVNASTVFFVGYDDHYKQGDLIDEMRFPTRALQRTNRHSSRNSRTCSVSSARKVGDGSRGPSCDARKHLSPQRVRRDQQPLPVFRRPRTSSAVLADAT